MISDQFRKTIIPYKRIGYNMNVIRQTASLVVGPITVYNFASRTLKLHAGRLALRFSEAPTLKPLIKLIGT